MRSGIVKLATAGLVLSLVLAPPAMGGEKKKKGKKQVTKTTRPETHPYSGVSGVEGPVGQMTACVQGTGCIATAPQKKEHYLAIEIADSTGTESPFLVTINGSSTSYCGSTSQPIWLNGATEISINVLAASATCTGIGSTGSLNLTFSNIP